MTSYWGNHNFEPLAEEDLVASFSRLAISHQWKKGSKKYRKEYADCFGRAFTERFGSDQGKLAGWQHLCEEVGIEPIPQSITQCKKALKQVYVNLVDLVQAREQGQRVKQFKNRNALRNYILDTEKFFPKRAAKNNGFLNVLLIEIF